MLMILDGWGHREERADNAVALAHKPNFDRLWAECPHAFLRTSGLDVGLPEGQMGNSEVGHLNIGAGRVVLQELPRIDAAIANGALAQNPALTQFIAKLRASGGTAHLLGLVSPGGVHSHQRHAAALAKILTDADLPVVIHALTDGRDTPPRSAGAALASLPSGVRIGTVIGRYWAMDRDHRWERVRKAWVALVLGQGEATAHDAQAVVAQAYAQHVTDEFIPATVLPGYNGMADGDGLLCFNFRSDRSREILTALLDPAFTGFARERNPTFAATLGMVTYSRELDPLIPALFAPQSMQDLLGGVVSAAGLTQLHMAETEKYPHVTFFFNGGEEAPYPGETRIVVPSPKVATYDLQPEMSAPELTARAVAAIREGQQDLIILNFANADMVGHSGILEAAIRAVEAVDAGLGAIAEAVREAGGALLVTADHGNAELMRDPVTGAPHTSHTTNPVPVFLLDWPAGMTLRDGRLADIAPTLLALLGLPQPPAMTGETLIQGA